MTINSDNFDELVASGQPLVLDFWATWCGPCKRVAPIIDALAQDYEGQVVIGKCDVDDDEELPVRFGVRNIPTILFIKDGQVVDRHVGAATRAALEDKIKALINA